MKYLIANTDYDWFHYLRNLNPVPVIVNFWRPDGKTDFAAIETGSPFLFRLGAPIQKVAGIGFFLCYLRIPPVLAWNNFKQKNGASSLEVFLNNINSKRAADNANSNIGVRILANPIFFKEEHWLQQPENWVHGIQGVKKYSTENPIGENYCHQIRNLLNLPEYSNRLTGVYANKEYIDWLVGGLL